MQCKRKVSVKEEEVYIASEENHSRMNNFDGVPIMWYQKQVLLSDIHFLKSFLDKKTR